MKLTFEKDAAEHVIEAFGWEVNDEGIIIDAEYTVDGEERKIFDERGREVKIDELGGIVKDDYGVPVPVKDDFNGLVNIVKNRRE